MKLIKFSVLLFLAFISIEAQSQVDWSKVIINVAGQIIQDKIESKSNQSTNSNQSNTYNSQNSSQSLGFQSIQLNNIKNSSQQEPTDIKLPSVSFAEFGWLPQNYNDLNVSGKRTIFSDDFSDNHNGWILKNTGKSISKIEDGYLKLEALSKEPSSKTLAVGLDQGMNYEIECLFRLNQGMENAAIYLNWGKSPYQNFGFGYSGDGKSIVIDKFTGSYNPILQWTDTRWLKPKGEFNKLTIRKLKQNIYFFVNEKLVHISGVEAFFGPHIGFMVPGNSQIEVDYLKVSELLKSDIRQKIQQYVVEKVNEWQLKGKYEKTNDYQLRVTAENRQKQANIFSQESIDKFATEKFDFNKVSNEYDSDNETFKLVFDNFAPVILSVPLAEAEGFEKNFSKMKYKNAKFTLTSDNQFALLHIEFIHPTTGKIYKYDSKNEAAFNSQDLSLNFENIKVDLPSENANKNQKKNPVKEVPAVSDVDVNIPKSTKLNSNVYALIIGNEDYSSFQTGLGTEVNVQFAENDAKIFYQYVTKTLGVPEKNVTLKTNATLGQMKQALAKLAAIAQVSEGKAQLIFYYSGHGLPDEVSKEAYIMPVDIAGTDVLSAIKLKDVYNNLTEYPADRVTIFLDACFSGGARNEALIAMKGVKIKPKESSATGNLIIFSSSSGEESSMVLKDKKHGLFTYYLLKKLKDTMGDVTYKSLSEYLKEKVSLEAVVSNNKKQTPQTLCSPTILEKWELWKMK